MKLNFTFLFFCMVSTITYGQISFEDHIFGTLSSFPASISPGDFDGDGDLDAVIASFSDNRIAWYENTNGLGDFGTRQILTSAQENAIAAYAVDLDGDGDIDILGSSRGDKSLVWLENTDGLANFSTPVTLASDLDFVSSIFPADLDNDGDIDALYSSWDNTIAWYENIDGLGTFGPKQLITNNTEWVVVAIPADLDGDGDLDVISASQDDNTVAWFKNDGNGNFGPKITVSTTILEAQGVHAEDLDGDGDLDLLSASGDAASLFWHENLDGLGSFGPQTAIATLKAGSMYSLNAADLDLDGDMDVIYAGRNGNTQALYWQENDGNNGNFINERVISIQNGIGSARLADIDGDGDTDILSVSWQGGNATWHENSLILSNETVIETTVFGITLNSEATLLNIESNFTISHIEVFDTYGKLILSEKDKTVFDISLLSQGVYILKVRDDQNKSSTKKFIKP